MLMTFESAFFDEDVMLPALAGALWPASAGSLHFPKFTGEGLVQRILHINYHFEWTDPILINHNEFLP
jgi:hypothetical protein